MNESVSQFASYLRFAHGRISRNIFNILLTEHLGAPGSAGVRRPLLNAGETPAPRSEAPECLLFLRFHWYSVSDLMVQIRNNGFTGFYPGQDLVAVGVIGSNFSQPETGF